MVSIPDGFFTPDELHRMVVVLGVEENELPRALEKLALSALAEYKQMLLGNGVPNRAEEIKWLRLFQLMRYYFVTRVPTEAEVCAMFQLTDTQSRSLIRNTRSRFRQYIEDQMLASCRDVIDSAEGRGNGYRVAIQSDNVLEELNALVGRLAPGLDPITKVKNMARTYEISADTYDFLTRLFAGPGQVAAAGQQ